MARPVRSNQRDETMKTTRWMAALVAGAAIAIAAGGVQSQETKAAPAAKAAQKAAAQRTFATPEEAVKALAEAVRASDVEGLVAVIGPKSRSWLFTGDKVSDAAEWKDFLAAFDRKNAIVKQGDAKASLVIGDDWPFPAPLVAKAGKWSFDADAGREEVMNRRVGRNELDTIQTLLAVVDAQREYATADADGNGLHDYAARIRSTPGKKDGLYWDAKPGEPASPLGPLMAKAVREGYGAHVKSEKPAPYNGYYFRLLTSQGRNAPGGAYDYLLRGKLFGGFAIVAWPASYGNSGVKTFLVNHEGVVYEKDLGAATPEVAASMKRFDPDKTWSKSKP
jgi:Protein of unknown function (DUF2950)